MAPTPYADLNSVLNEVVGTLQRILAGDFCRSLRSFSFLADQIGLRYAISHYNFGLTLPVSIDMRRQISRICIGQTSKFFAVLYGVIGLVIAAVYLFTSRFAGGAGFNPLLALVFPIIYAACVWGATAVLAWIYNQLASRIGGVEFEVVDVASNPGQL